MLMTLSISSDHLVEKRQLKCIFMTHILAGQKSEVLLRTLLKRSNSRNRDCNTQTFVCGKYINLAPHPPFKHTHTHTVFLQFSVRELDCTGTIGGADHIAII